MLFGWTGIRGLGIMAAYCRVYMVYMTKITRRLTAKRTGSAPSKRSLIEYGTTLFYFI